MWNSYPLNRQRTHEEQPRFPLHNIDESRGVYVDANGRLLQRSQIHDDDSPESGSTLVEGDERVPDNPWGERDVGGPVDAAQAIQNYEELRRELTALSKTSSKKDTIRDNKLSRTISRSSTKRTTTRQTTNASDGDDLEAGEGNEEEEFDLDEFMREGHFEKRKDGHSQKKVGVVFKNLTVKGVGATSTFVKTLPDAIIGTFGPDLYRLLCKFFPIFAFGGSGEKRVLINKFTGIVRDGEMMLVLGRPGAGCSTFLKAIANNRESFAEVEGEVTYGGIDAATQRKHYRGEVNYNPEDDVHFAELSVWQTFIFALLNKTKKRDKEEVPVIANALMKMFGISHTRDTKIGNEYVRGISGGERKRVSIAETLATKSTVLCWDNSTRGLDASTALDYAKSLRIMTDVSNKTTLTTLYQAGEEIYNQMDKVMVIHTGRCIYQGPAKEARQYFIDLGFDAPERETTADFLTSCTDENERRFREGCEDSTPKSADELEKAFLESEAYKKVLADVEDYELGLKETNMEDAEAFKQSVQESKSNKTVPKSSPYTVSFFQQVLACARREFWLLWGDKTTLYTKTFIIIANGLIVGSLFYGQPTNTAGAFSRGGSVFFSIIFLGWLQLTELMKAVTGRAVVDRQHDYAFYRPSAVSIARVLVDLPILLPQVIVFSVIMYWLTGLDADVSKFWIYLLFIYITTINMTALYRMFASLSPAIDDAVRFSGIALNLLIIMTGYVIVKPQLVSDYIWFGWIYYVNPLSYSFEGVLTNELYDRSMHCAEEQLVPLGPGTNPNYQGCALTGSSVNSKVVAGSQYLASTFSYYRSNLWRNFGVVIAFTVLYILITAWATETFNFAQTGGGAMVFKKNWRSKKNVKQPPPADEEKGKKVEESSASSERTGRNAEQEALQEISGSKSVFTWENVSYHVPVGNGHKQLLNQIDGYAIPGRMIALMGASGAGKTTLLQVLAQRQSVGIVEGDMLVDGHELGTEFQRGTGFCEQQDIHDSSTTIREALEFSAILRQDRKIPRAEKIAYVDEIIDLLELNDIQDAIVSCLGVEQRKRLTIGVELAAKPSLLLFLDEPTSGLDSQSAFSIVRFLRKLSDAGQAIVCTIHQPSSLLIQQFDGVIALNPGGRTFYFGKVGHDGEDVVKYFADLGFQCPPGKNIAEFMLELAAKTRKRADGTRINLDEEWKNSENAREVKNEIARLKEERGKVAQKPSTELHEFAAPLWTQIIQLTTRLFRQYWRDPSYYYGKLFVAVVVGILNGFTFYMLGNTQADLQNRMFSSFLILTIPPTVVNAVVPKFFTNMMLWQAREYPSRIYGWVAFTTAQVVAEIPISVVQSALYFLTSYFPIGFPVDASTAGYVFLMSLLFFFFMASWGQWITAFATSFTVISNVLPFFFVMFSLFNGVVRPYSSLPVFWRYFMYYLNPSTYWIGGVLAAVMPNIQVQCTISETAKFRPPPGQTCMEYAGAFVQSAPGYLLNPNSTDVCNYCAYSTGADYIATLNIYESQKWRNFGIFLGFTISNWLLVYLFIYTVRIKGFKFGFGYLFGGLGKLVDLLKKPFQKKSQEDQQENQVEEKTTVAQANERQTAEKTEEEQGQNDGPLEEVESQEEPVDREKIDKQDHA